ncbi:MAG: xanthine dehydrogenase family protein subunit M [Halomonas sp.]|uniref:FAD binding domain-containing protein n=1 Tax=Halomonas sp. TaxID=1486246 RepID=UPI00286FBD3E|nr:xanthine dehydrogenase family protein subunit M [Halomonas sp.]MDR9438367.1 xanthine dehydrogenase family protein subunit M [Halomonas sp.]
MKSPQFDYVRPGSLDQVLALLAEHGDEAQVIAGGQSLVPTMNMRLAAPSVLVDLNHVPGLSGVELRGKWLRIGALTRHAEMVRSPEVARHAPLLARAAPFIAHEAIRNRGTFGGSVATADPASEWPACCLTLGARIHLASRNGTRTVPAEEFFEGVYQTAIEPHELITHVEVPAAAGGMLYGFDELARRKGDYAIVGLAAQARVGAKGPMKLLRRNDQRLYEIRLSFFGVAETPMLAQQAAAALEGRPLDAEAIQAAQSALADDLQPLSDLYTSAEAKTHLTRVLLGRVLHALSGDPSA